MPTVLPLPKTQTSYFRHADGRKEFVNGNFRENYDDEHTQERLPEASVRTAIIDELSYFNAEVWTGVDVSVAKADLKDNSYRAAGWQATREIWHLPAVEPDTWHASTIRTQTQTFMQRPRRWKQN